MDQTKQTTTPAAFWERARQRSDAARTLEGNSDAALRARAAGYLRDDSIVVDHDAPVVASFEGAWVQAFVFVPYVREG